MLYYSAFCRFKSTLLGDICLTNSLQYSNNGRAGLFWPSAPKYTPIPLLIHVKMKHWVGIEDQEDLFEALDSMATFEDAIALMNKYVWPDLYPLVVHPE
jgi:hypothetical protein